MSLSAWPFVFLLLSLATASQAQPAQEEPVLAAGAVVEKEIAGGETHRYRLELATRDYLRTVVEQHGVNVAVVLRGPDGQIVLDRDRQPNRLRPERVSAVVDAAGRYVLEVRAGSGEPPGRYRVRIEALRAATVTDRTQAAADTMDGEGPPGGGGEAPPGSGAKSRLNALLAEFRASGDHHGQALALYHLGVVGLRNSDPHAFVPLQEALALFREQDNEYGQMLVLTSLGDGHDWQHDKRAALASYEEGLALGDRVGDRVASAFYLHKAGLILASVGQAERALDYFTRARSLYVTNKDRTQEARAVNNIGMALKMLGDHRRALAFVEEALSLSRAAGIEDGGSGLLVNIGKLQGLLGDYVAARSSHDEALSLARRAHSTEEEAAGLNNLAALSVLQGDYPDALESSRRALALWRALQDRYGEAESLNIMGESLHRLGQADAALERLREAADIRERFHARHTLAETLLEMAVVERDRGRLREALAQAQAAVELVEQLRSAVTNPELRASFVASRQDTYAVYIDILMRLHHVEPSAGHDIAALEVSERARARVLMEVLIEARADIRAGVDAVLLESERAAQKQLSEASERLSHATTQRSAQADVARARADFAAKAEELRLVQAQIRQSSPRYAALTQPVPATLEEIRRDVLDADTVLLEFYLGPERSFLWAATETDLVSAALPKSARIHDAARTVHELLTQRQRSLGSAAVVQADARLSTESRQLSRLLLGGIAQRLAGEWKGKRLLIVASGALAYVPFGVLPSPVAAHPLAADHEIVYAPSASVMVALRKEHAAPSAPAESVAIVADPVFEASDPRVRGERPVPVNAPNTGLRRAAESLGRAGFARLPFSRREAEGIAAGVPATGLLRATDFHASRSLVTSGALDRSRIVHFATHGLLDSEHPDLSGLVLSLVDPDGAPVDGFLRMHEIYNLKMQADLVVLSACQTALGREIRGEGLIGLTRGFMYAGARAVVASLWQVDDESTAELMKRFYRGMLKENRRPADALRAAQLEMERDKRWSAPFYWAGFVLQGEWN